MSWFYELSKAQQSAYLKKHPNSKYAKRSKSSKKSKSASTAKTSKTKLPRIAHLTELIKRTQDKYFRARNSASANKHKSKLKKYQKEYSSITGKNSLPNGIRKALSW